MGTFLGYFGKNDFFTLLMKWPCGKDTSNDPFEPKIAPDHPWHRPSMKKDILTQSNHPVACNFAKVGQKMTFFSPFHWKKWSDHHSYTYFRHPLAPKHKYTIVLNLVGPKIKLHELFVNKKAFLGAFLGYFGKNDFFYPIYEMTMW